MKTKDEFIEALGKIVEKSDRMVLIVSDSIEVHSTFFNYADMQILSYLLQRTSCEWWIKPNDDKMIKLTVRLF
jgi:hypothetical protein